jgi:hypothetical protein
MPDVLVRLAETPWIDAPNALRAVDALAGAVYGLWTTAGGPFTAPAFAPELPLPPRLAALARALTGRLTVTNAAAVFRLPRPVGELARAVLRHALAPTPPVPNGFLVDARDAADRRRVTELLARVSAPARAAFDAAVDGGVAWCAAALYEPSAPARLDLGAVGSDTAIEPPPVAATLRFRLALVVGRGAPPDDWSALDAAVHATPAVPWPPAAAAARAIGVARVLVPESVVVPAMDASMRARWLELTGRTSADGGDRYWFPESWERFLEPDRLVGFVTPADVARSRPEGRARADLRLTELDDDLTVGAFTPAVDRGVCVPPGFCLVDCTGTLEVALVGVDEVESTPASSGA